MPQSDPSPLHRSEPRASPSHHFLLNGKQIQTRKYVGKKRKEREKEKGRIMPSPTVSSSWLLFSGGSLAQHDTPSTILRGTSRSKESWCHFLLWPSPLFLFLLGDSLLQKLAPLPRSGLSIDPRWIVCSYLWTPRKPVSTLLASNRRSQLSPTLPFQNLAGYFSDNFRSDDILPVEKAYHMLFSRKEGQNLLSSDTI